MGLAVDVFLVLVETRHLVVVLDFAVRVVGAALIQVVAADAVPGVVGVFLAAKGDEPQRRLVVEVAHLAEVAHQFAAGAVAVAVAADARQARLDGPVVAQHAGAHAQGLLVGVKGAVAARHLGIGVAREALGPHVHAAAEGARAVGRGASAALYLDVAHARGKVRRVHPVDAVALGIVQRDVVHRDVDAGGVRTAHAHRRVTHASTRVAGGDYARCHRQQERDVQAMVFGSQLLGSHITKRYRSVCTRTSAQHLHLAQGDGRHCVGCGSLCHRNEASQHRGSRQKDLLHAIIRFLKLRNGLRNLNQ